jgi:Zn-dependent protease with chaperone function
MAHELSHVLLRHGTANATKAQGFQLGALAGAIAGAVVGGGLGSVISQGASSGLARGCCATAGNTKSRLTSWARR